MHNSNIDELKFPKKKKKYSLNVKNFHGDLKHIFCYLNLNKQLLHIIIMLNVFNIGQRWCFYLFRNNL